MVAVLVSTMNADLDECQRANAHLALFILIDAGMF